MLALDEDLITAYARQPDDLSAAQQARAEKLIAEDADAGRVYAFYSVFFDEYTGSRRQADSRFEALARSLAPMPRVIPLRRSARHLDVTAPEPRDAESAESGKPVILVSEREDLIFRCYLDDTSSTVRIYACRGSGDALPCAHGLVMLPEAHTGVKLGSTGRGTLMDAAAEVSELFRGAAFYPIQHVESVDTASLLHEPGETLPGFRLRIRTSEDSSGWMPMLHTDLSDIRFVAVEWSIDEAGEGAQEQDDRGEAQEQGESGEAQEEGNRAGAQEQDDGAAGPESGRTDDARHQHIFEKTGSEAVLTIDGMPRHFVVAIYG